jgi:hypothetical protein
VAEDYGKEKTFFEYSEVGFSFKMVFFSFFREYEKRGYNANQDVPSNLYWREFATCYPNAKVI